MDSWGLKYLCSLRVTTDFYDGHISERFQRSFWRREWAVAGTVDERGLGFGSVPWCQFSAISESRCSHLSNGSNNICPETTPSLHEIQLWPHRRWHIWSGQQGPGTEHPSLASRKHSKTEIFEASAQEHHMWGSGGSNGPKQTLCSDVIRGHWPLAIPWKLYSWDPTVLWIEARGLSLSPPWDGHDPQVRQFLRVSAFPGERLSCQSAVGTALRRGQWVSPSWAVVWPAQHITHPTGCSLGPGVIHCCVIIELGMMISRQPLVESHLDSLWHSGIISFCNKKGPNPTLSSLKLKKKCRRNRDPKRP